MSEELDPRRTTRAFVALPDFPDLYSHKGQQGGGCHFPEARLPRHKIRTPGPDKIAGSIRDFVASCAEDEKK
ncbi:MAG: hypothetical protein NTV48_00965 [Candidatus Vogelbacteria bacterium]|nr:hypothetical protein [Candidatus Vogelbacteria bacterium]